MRAIGQLASLVFGISLLGAMGFGVYLAIERLIALFARLDPEVANVTGIACVIALISASAIARAITRASRESKAMVLREEKTATYQLLLDVWTNVLGHNRAQMSLLQTDLSGKQEAVARLLAVYGSAAVIKAHMALGGLARNKGRQHPEVRARLGDLLVAVRNDLGTDTPRNIADKLERLLLPEPDADGRPAEADAARLSTQPA
jgi:hypothetical protein